VIRLVAALTNAPSVRAGKAPPHQGRRAA